MALTKTPVCDFGKKAENFKLKSINNKVLTLNDIKGEKATLIMFICNHCPYVKAIIKDLAKDCNELRNDGISSVAIMSNDTKNYPEDSFDNMKKLATKYNFTFPYLYDETQEVAKLYGAVCTPDFFGFNKNKKLQYRGRLDASRKEAGSPDLRRDLFEAMKGVAQTGKGPSEQIASMGCSIKWKSN